MSILFCAFMQEFVKCDFWCNILIFICAVLIKDITFYGLFSRYLNTPTHLHYLSKKCESCFKKFNIHLFIDSHWLFACGSSNYCPRKTSFTLMYSNPLCSVWHVYLYQNSAQVYKICKKIKP